MQQYAVTFVLPDGVRTTLRIAADDFLWQAAGRAGLDLPSRCRIGWCLSCAARLLAPGAVDQSAARRYFAEDRAAGFVLLCTAKPRSPLVLATHQENALREHRQALGLPASLG